MTLPLPKRRTIDFTRRYPHAARLADEMRAASKRGKLPPWPQWCFLPIGAVQAITSPDPDAGETPESIHDAAVGAALLAWRVSQGIYRFDPDLLEELWETPVSGEIPTEVLYRLPQWCVYIETPGREAAGHRIAGFFAHLEYDVDTHAHELRLLFDTGSEKEDSLSEMALLPIPLRIDSARTVEEAIRSVLERSFANRNALAERVRVLIESGMLSRQDLPEDLSRIASLEIELEDEDVKRLSESLGPPISLLLYLASATAEISSEEGEKPQNPTPKRTRRGERLFPPDTETYWQTGYRLGAALRAARRQATASATESEPQDERPRRRRPVAHIRRAHWHTYWVGPRKEPARRERTVKWIPPLLVGADDPEELIPTVYPVKGSE